MDNFISKLAYYQISSYIKRAELSVHKELLCILDQSLKIMTLDIVLWIGPSTAVRFHSMNKFVFSNQLVILLTPLPYSN